MIGRHMPESDGRTLMLRAFVDGPPDDGMIQGRFDTKSRLCPRSEAWATEDGRVCLCDAAYESGYDAAIMHAKAAIEPLLVAASDALNASYHSEAWAKATVRNRLSDELNRLRKVGLRK